MKKAKKWLMWFAENLKLLFVWIYASPTGRPKAFVEGLDSKLIEWMEQYPKISAWLPAHTAQVTRKSRIWICALMGLILFCPIRNELPDGGSVEYRSMTYSLVRWEFFKEDVPDPRDADKITIVRLYGPMTCRTRNIWERQSDQAALLGCNVYRVTQSKDQNRIEAHGYKPSEIIYDIKTTYEVSINGYRTNDRRMLIYDESGRDKDWTFQSENKITWFETQLTRLMIDLNLIWPERITPPLKTLIPESHAEMLTGRTEESIYFWRMKDPAHKWYNWLIPVKNITYYVWSGDHEHPCSVSINLLDNKLVSYDQF